MAGPRRAKTKMKPSTESAPAKPGFALAIATACGVGYIPKAPGTFGSSVGILTAMATALFFLRPHSLRDLLSTQRLTEATLMDHNFLVPGAEIHNAALLLPVVSAILVVLFLSLVGVWSAGKAAAYAGTHDPQHVQVGRRQDLVVRHSRFRNRLVAGPEVRQQSHVRRSA